MKNANLLELKIPDFKRIAAIGFLMASMVLFFCIDVYAQCGSSPCFCEPVNPNEGGHGPDPCDAKLYCSNSGAVEEGLINCTTAADTDGCGVEPNASVDGITDYFLLNMQNCFNAEDYSHVQWMKLATPPMINKVKIQGVGKVDAWAVYYAGAVDQTTITCDLGVYLNFYPNDCPVNPDCFSDPLNDPCPDPDCPVSDCSTLTLTAVPDACSDANQYEIWTNPDAVLDPDFINVYYIALLYDGPSNGTMNFKVKECETELVCEPDIACPDDQDFECGSLAEVEAWLDEAGGDNCGDPFCIVNDFDPADYSACSSSGTVTFSLMEVDCSTPILDGDGNPVECEATWTVTAPAVQLDCQTDEVQGACMDQSVIADAFTAWLEGTTFSGGCDAEMTNNAGTPNACGGTTTVTWTVTSSCEPDVTCSADFIVTAPPAVSLDCATNEMIPACTSQSSINTAYSNWLASASFTGGCDASLSNDAGSAPNACGGTTTVTWTVTSTCEADVTCSASFEVATAEDVDLDCATNETIPACTSQSDINTAYSNWLNSASFTGGCNGGLSHNSSPDDAPDDCGGSVMVTWTVTSDCELDVTCAATFTVTDAPDVDLDCVDNMTVDDCMSQDDVNDTFADWLASTTFTGGCDANISNNAPSSAPDPCTGGGVVDVIWTVTSTCEVDVTCQRSFTVPAAEEVVLDCVEDMTTEECMSQGDIDDAFAVWLGSTSFTGGCDPQMTNDYTGSAPSACGSTTTVTWTVTSACQMDETCDATFEVPTPAAVSIDCAESMEVDECMSQTDINTAFNSWLMSTTFAGGCNATISNNSVSPPDACGGTVNVIWTVTSACENDVTCGASFEVAAAPVVSLDCVDDMTTDACLSQGLVDQAYADWLAATSYEGGCDASMSNDAADDAPDACDGGSVVVIWTVTSTCESDVTCERTFSVPAAPAVSLDCVADMTTDECLSQGMVDQAYADWLAATSYEGGCEASMSNDAADDAPDACDGGSVVVIWTVTSTCESDVTCERTFSVPAAPAVSLDCVADMTTDECMSQGMVDQAYADWLAATSYEGGCDASMSNNAADDAPDACDGGSVVVIWTVTSTCESDVTCERTFSVPAAPAVSLDCVADMTTDECMNQDDLDDVFAAWLGSTSFTGGCDPTMSNDYTGPAPDICGSTTSVTWTVTSACEGPVTCSADFEVPTPEAVELDCASDMTIDDCVSQDEINTAYTNWLNSASFTGGCNGELSNNGPASAPNACAGGGTVDVTWTVTSSCELDVTCMASFTVPGAEVVVLDCAEDMETGECMSQDDINDAFASWLMSASFEGGCDADMTNDGEGLEPSACGSTTTVIWTVTSACEGPVTCSADFEVPTPAEVAIDCQTDMSIDACTSQGTIDDAYEAWLLGTSFSGGCNGTLSNDAPDDAPDACDGGTTTVTWTVTSSCEAPVTCSASFSVAAAPPVVLDCQTDMEIPACTSQTDIDAAYAAWIMGTSFSGGCDDATLMDDAPADAPDACDGGTTTVTWSVMSACGMQESCSASFEVPADDPPVAVCPPDDGTLTCLDDIPCPSDVKDYVEENSTDDCGIVSVTIVNDTGFPDCVDGMFSRTYELEVTDGCGQTDRCTVTYSGTCGNYCTLTQGGWGNYGGQYPWNDDDGKAPTQDIIDALIEEYGNVIIGRPDLNRSLEVAAECVVPLLPAAGGPKVLTEGTPTADEISDCDAGDNPQNNQKRLKNNLATNTIALQLNIWYGLEYSGDDLGSYDLTDGCANISQSFIDFMIANGYTTDVYGLLQLANDVLGGVFGTKKKDYQSIAGAVTGAITTIHEYWHECEVADPCGEDRIIAEHYDFSEEEELEKRVEELGVLLRPNPVEYEDVELLIFAEDEQKVAIKVFNISGHAYVDHSMNVEKGINTYTISNELLANGLYFVQIVNQNGDVFVQRFVKTQE